MYRITAILIANLSGTGKSGNKDSDFVFCALLAFLALTFLGLAYLCGATLGKRLPDEIEALVIRD